MNRTRLASASLSTLAVILLGILQGLSWGHFEAHNPAGSFYGFTYPGSDVKVDTRTWDIHATTNGNSNSQGWYSKDAEDHDGVALFRTAIPFLLAALVVAGVAAIATVFVPSALGPGLSFVAGALSTTATVLFAVGVDQFYGDVDYSWRPGFYVGILASACLLAAGIVALVVPRLKGSGVPAGLQ